MQKVHTHIHLFKVQNGQTYFKLKLYQKTTYREASYFHVKNASDSVHPSTSYPQKQQTICVKLITPSPLFASEVKNIQIQRREEDWYIHKDGFTSLKGRPRAASHDEAD